MANISSISDLIDLSTGVYGYGSASEYLEVNLTTDIDFNDYTQGYMFTGCSGTWYVNFNGNGHSIKNIYYTGANDWYFFENFTGTISNLKIDDINIVTTGYIRLGYAVGRTDLIDVNVTGILESLNNAVCPFFSMSNNKVFHTITRCSIVGNLKGTLVGILALQNGVLAQGEVYDCNAYGEFISTGDMTVTGCAKSWRLGIVGVFQCVNLYWNNSSAFCQNDCYLVIKPTSTITGAVYSSTNNGITNNCYYDADVLPQGITISDGSIPATTAQLQSKTFMNDTLKWNTK